MFTLFVTHKDGRKENLGTFNNLNETYDRYIRGVEEARYKSGDVVNTVSNNTVERYF